MNYQARPELLQESSVELATDTLRQETEQREEAWINDAEGAISGRAKTPPKARVDRFLGLTTRPVKTVSPTPQTFPAYFGVVPRCRVAFEEA